MKRCFPRPRPCGQASHGTPCVGLILRGREPHPANIVRNSPGLAFRSEYSDVAAISPRTDEPPYSARSVRATLTQAARRARMSPAYSATPTAEELVAQSQVLQQQWAARLDGCVRLRGMATIARGMIRVAASDPASVGAQLPLAARAHAGFGRNAAFNLGQIQGVPSSDW